MLSDINNIHEKYSHTKKDLHKAVIYRTIAMNNNTTRKTLAKLLSIRPTTVCTLVNELVEDNLVIEKKLTKNKSSGRPKILLKLNPNKFMVAVIYAESRTLKSVLINLQSDIITQNSINISKDCDTKSYMEICSKQLDNIIQYVPDNSTLLGTGISLFGTVNSKTKTWVESSTRWKDVGNLNFSFLEEKTPIHVHRILDSELAFLISKDKVSKNTILFHWGFGVGSAISNDGKIFGSTIGRIGEIGHTKLFVDSNDKCLCGSTGCVETKAALWAILPELRKKWENIPEDETKLYDFIENTPDIEKQECVIKATEYAAMALTNLYKITYPDKIFCISPFLANKKIKDKFSSILKESTTKYVKNGIDIDVVQDRFKGSLFGSAYPIFFDALRKSLKARS